MVQTEEIRQRIQVLLNFFNAKKYDEVINRVKPLIKKNPGEVIFHNLLALSLNGSGNAEEGIKILNNALRIFPNNIFIFNNLGLLNTSENNYKEAENYFKKALKIKDNFFDTLINYSFLKLNINQGNEAIKILNKIEIKSENENIVRLAFGNAYQQIGDFENSIKHFKRCLKLNPSNTIADKSLSVMIKYDENNDHYKSMINKKSDSLNLESKINLYFAIGKAKEDLKKYKESFEYIKKANDIKNSLIKYDITKDLKITENSKKLFKSTNNTYVENLNKRKFIFIIRMPRSGTTLLEQILSSHSKVYGAGELNFMSNIIHKFFINKNLSFKKEDIDKFEEEFLDSARNYYKENTSLFNYKEEFLTDKAPLNFRWVGFIIKLFPNCKIINCHRDLMDICWSNYKNQFTSNKMDYCYNFKNLSSFAKMYLDIMDFWNKKYPNKIFNINYESLVNRPGEEIRNLLEYCGLSWDPDCMNFYKKKNIVSTASVAQVRNPLYKSSINSWKNYSEELSDLKNLLKK